MTNPATLDRESIRKDMVSYLFNKYCLDRLPTHLRTGSIKDLADYIYRHGISIEHYEDEERTILGIN